MQFDFSKLRGRIIERFGTCAAFAEAAGISTSVLSYRLDSKTYFTMPEIYRFIQPDLLDIPAAEIGVYFFALKVR